MQQSFTVPYIHTSPLHIPRRDLVASSVDSLSLRVTVVQGDNPAAQLLVISTGLGGPQAQLLIWEDWRGQPCCWDYGRPRTAGTSLLWSGMGTPQVGLGAFDFSLPAGRLQSLPPRCGWGVQLGWGSDRGDLLCVGTLHIRQVPFGPIPPYEAPLLTDDSIPVLENDTDPVFV